jgi:hypothetical protein
MTREGTPKPQQQKESYQVPKKGSLPVHLRNGGNGREEKSRMGSTQRAGGGVKFFL